MNTPAEFTPEYDKLITFFNRSVEITEKASSSKEFCDLLLNSLYEIFDFKTSNFWLCDAANSTYFLASHRIKNLVSQYFYTQNPLFADNLMDKYELVRDRNVLTIPDVMSMEDYESSQYFKDYMSVPDPYYYTALMLIKSPYSVIGAIAFLKSKSEGDFTPTDLGNLNIISNFISNLALNHMTVNNLITQNRLFESLSNQSPTGLIIFNTNYPYKIGYMNSAAYRYTAELCPDVRNQNSGDEFLIKHVIDEFGFPEYASSKTVLSPFDKKYIVNITPSQTTDHFASSVYVYIIPMVETAMRKEPLLTNGNNLTKRQIEIIELVILGKTNEEIASQLFISVNTVKTHLNNIYRELNVSNRFSLYSKLTEN